MRRGQGGPTQKRRQGDFKGRKMEVKMKEIGGKAHKVTVKTEEKMSDNDDQKKNEVKVIISK